MSLFNHHPKFINPLTMVKGGPLPVTVAIKTVTRSAMTPREHGTVASEFIACLGISVLAC
jgi:hypothetical protein